jgi:hypothetical protein
VSFLSVAPDRRLRAGCSSRGLGRGGADRLARAPTRVDDHPLDLPRIEVTGTDSLDTFIAKLG